ncbi:MAG TPA: BTAD domain-containing putative transcriptional regulator [Actinocatenispora sp.]
MRITLLGTLDLRTDDDRPVPVATRKRREVLAALALDLNRIVPTDTLLTAVWGEEPPPAARSALQGHIAQLRKDLDAGMRLVTRAPGYVLLAEPDAVDAHRFRALARRGLDAAPDDAVPVLREALALWRGPALAGLGGTRLAEWAADLAETRLCVLETLGEHLVAAGRGAEQLAELREAARAHPFRESLVRLVMLALYQDDQQAEAMAVYHRTRAALADELGVDPGPALRAGYESILRGEGRGGPAAPVAPAPAPVPAAPVQLPAAPRRFAGRTGELADLADAGDLVLLTGPAGVGKTALAVHWAHRTVTAGALYADLRGFGPAEPADPADVLARFLTALGAAVPDGLDARAAAYRSALAGRDILVVLDDAATPDQVRPLLPGAGARVVVTSRRRLDGLVAIDGATPLPVGPLPAGDATELLVTLVGRRRLATDPPAVRRLVAACDGLPLALRIVAARLTTRPDVPVAGVADSLADESTRLTVLCTDDDTASVAAAFASTSDRLPDGPLRLLRALGRGAHRTVTLTDAATLAGLTPDAVRHAFRALDTCHLGTVLPGDRFAVTALTHLYARHLAAAPAARPRLGIAPHPTTRTA